MLLFENISYLILQLINNKNSMQQAKLIEK